jgi:three-Cys-motif partner protein
MSSSRSSQLKLDEIGKWSEIKLEIIRKYAHAYTTILTSHRLSPIYIDGFAGAGEHISRATGERIKGSPSEAFDTRPPFAAFHLVDLEGTRADALKALAAGRTDTKIYQDDCNDVLLNEVFPQITSSRFNRALCILDPYGLHLDWQVMEAAGRTGQIEIFLNFATGDMQRNVFRKDQSKVTAESLERMNRFWGDESWKPLIYTTQPGLFGDIEEKDRQSIANLLTAFKSRLKEVAGFGFVPEPVPMKNSKGTVIYHLFYASPKSKGGELGQKIVRQIMDKYRAEGQT